MKSVPLYQIDAFTTKPFGGNPAAVLLQDADSASQMSDETRQNIASEMNLSETSFVELQNTGNSESFQTSSHFNLRWFTPAKEVALCGHATLAAAAAIFDGEGNTSKSLHFHTRKSGELVVTRSDGDSSEFSMDLPNEKPDSNVPKLAQHESPLIKSILGSANVEVKEILFSHRLQYLMIVLQDGTSRKLLESIQTDTRACLQAASKNDLVLAIVTANGSEGCDFMSRVFCPWAGIEEDPVTGSAHAVSGPYWAEQLGKSKMKALQCSKRIGDVGVEIVGEKIVRVSGSAAIVFKGSLYI